MVFGPCGGVRRDGGCELDGHPCPFAVGTEPVAWWGAGPEAPDVLDVRAPARPESRLLAAIRQGPVVVTDLTLPPYDAAAVGSLTRLLRESSDALLVGEHQNRPDFPPTQMAALVAAAGGNPWLTLTCRDRNRLVLEQELAGLLVSGADGVLCVTGDGRAHGVRPEVTQVFDLDGTQLAAVAAGLGHAVAVPESPQATPRELRPGRLVQKQRAGAHLAILNHVASPGAVRTFVARARDLGLTIPVVAAVAVFTDQTSARVMGSFPGLDLDPTQVERVLGASDPRRAGIELAVAEAEELLDVEGVSGVNLSGLASGGGVVAGAEVKAEIGSRLRRSR
jgi:5,10-methylenetetrahydrofolate reductase